MNIRDLPLAEIKPHPGNPRLSHDVDGIARSMAAHVIQPVVVYEGDGMLIAGHGRLLAAQKLGLDTLPVYVVPADQITPGQAAALRLADNRAAEGSQWDDGLLLAAIEGLMGEDEALAVLAGFEGPDIESLRRLVEAAGAGEPDPTEDDVPEAPAVPVSKLGDLWQMGDHLLVCGDATSADDVARLGDLGHLMVTDPPYGVSYDPAWRVRQGFRTKVVGRVANDDISDWREAWALFKGDVAYMWSSHKHLVISAVSLIAAGFEMRTQIIWSKKHHVLGRGNYHSRHESCWYAVRKGCKAHWRGDRTQSTVWNVAKFNDNSDDAKTIHSTQKPVEIMRRPMFNNSSEGDLVYEPFCGSGTSIIAAETIKRRCRAIEIDPTYCDMIVDRWQRFTGKQATLEATGKTFADLRAEQERTP